jgi:hypothetical protein
VLSTSSWQRYRVAAVRDTIKVSLQKITFAVAATRRDGDCRLSFDVPVVGDGKAAVDGMRDGHDCQDVGELFKGDAAHSRSSNAVTGQV